MFDALRERAVGGLVQAFALLAALAGGRAALRHVQGGAATPPFEELLRRVTGDSRMALALAVALVGCFLVAYVGAKLTLKSLALSLKLSVVLMAAACLVVGLLLLAM